MLAVMNVDRFGYTFGDGNPGNTSERGLRGVRQQQRLDWLGTPLDS
jgi:hypothetical protein